jgi:hypothetical protein
MTLRNINNKKRILKYPKRKKENIDPQISNLHDNLKYKSKTKNNFYSVYNYLDYILNKYKK